MIKFISKAIRFLSAWTFVALTIPIFWGLSILRPLNYLLRAFNIPNAKMPLDIAQKLWCHIVVFLAGIRVEVTGLENLKDDDRKALKEKNYVILANHVTGLDPWIIGAFFPGMFPKMTFKKELMYTLAPIFLLSRILGHISIDRGNREKAMSAMEDAGKKIKKFGRSVLVFPEGTRSKSGKLQNFKKGAFHLSKGAGIPIAPLLITGVYELWPSGIFPDSGTIRLSILPLINVTSLHTVDSLLSEVFEKFAEAQKSTDPPKKFRKTGVPLWQSTVALAVMWSFILFLAGYF